MALATTVSVLASGCGSSDTAGDDAAGDETSSSETMTPTSTTPTTATPPSTTPTSATPTSAPPSTVAVDGLAGLDVDALHDLEEALHAGRLDPSTQVPLVSATLDHVRTARWPADVDVDELEQALEALLAALNDGDTRAAATAAGVVHDVAHDLLPH